MIITDWTELTACFVMNLSLKIIKLNAPVEHILTFRQISQFFLNSVLQLKEKIVVVVKKSKNFTFFFEKVL